MAKLLKLRRGTTTQHGSFTGAEGEVTIDTTKDTAVVHDGTTQSGHTLLREDLSNLPAGQIDNADINASAAIAGTKISPDFGSQNLTTGGNITTTGGYLEVQGTQPQLRLNDTDSENDFELRNQNGSFVVRDIDASSNRFIIASNGTISTTGNLDVGSGIDVTGAITSTGNLTITNGNPIINFTDSNNNSDFRIQVEAGSFLIEDTTNSGADRFVIDSNGTTSIAGNLDVGSGVDVTGNITCTGTVDGRDVASDGSKLDGIESGATADQTKSDIDGLNINADQVDGLHASSFVRSDQGDTMSGNYNMTGALTVGHGSNSSDIYMTDNDETTRRIHCNSNRIGFLTSSSGWGCYADNSGNWTAVGNVTAYSDAKLKTNVNTINDALGIVGKLRGVSFDWKGNGKPSIGLIAQEVEEVIPELVVTNRGTIPDTGETEEIKSVDYGKIVGVLINAINELKAEVDALKKPKKKGGK